jgi:hypothetical protein
MFPVNFPDHCSPPHVLTCDPMLLFAIRSCRIYLLSTGYVLPYYLPYGIPGNICVICQAVMCHTSGKGRSSRFFWKLGWRCRVGVDMTKCTVDVQTTCGIRLIWRTSRIILISWHRPAYPAATKATRQDCPSPILRPAPARRPRCVRPTPRER